MNLYVLINFYEFIKGVIYYRGLFIINDQSYYYLNILLI